MGPQANPPRRPGFPVAPVLDSGGASPIIVAE